MIRDAGGLEEMGGSSNGRCAKHLGVLNAPRDTNTGATSLVGCIGTTTEICAALQGPGKYTFTTILARGLAQVRGYGDSYKSA